MDELTAATVEPTDDGPAPSVGFLTICFVSRAVPAHRLGGLEHHVQDLARGLQQRGHQVHILTTIGASDGARADVEADGLSELQIHTIAGTKPGDYSIQFFRRVESAVRDLHQRHKFDVIVPIDFAGLFFDPAQFDVPVAPLVHGTMTSEVPLDWRYWGHLTLSEKVAAVWRYKSRPPLIAAFTRMIDRADAIVVDSEFTRRELMFTAAEGTSRDSTMAPGRMAVKIARKTHIAPLGIDLQRYPGAGEYVREETLSGAPLKICLLGRLQKMKGVEIAIRAAAHLRARGVAFHMSIAGTGDYAEEAVRLVRELQLGDAVTLSGRIAPDDLASFLHGHDVFLFPDLAQPAFGLVAVEAMAHGLPVVAARSGAIPEVVTMQVGWLYDPWNVSALAETLALVAGDRGEIREKAAAAKAGAEFYTSEKMAARAETVLSQIARAGKKNGGADEARTRDLRRDRPAF